MNLLEEGPEDLRVQGSIVLVHDDCVFLSKHFVHYVLLLGVSIEL